MDLRKSLEFAAGKDFGPSGILQAIWSVLTPLELQTFKEEAKRAVRLEEAEDASWLQWSQLGRELAPLLLREQGRRGEDVVVAAAKKCRS